MIDKNYEVLATCFKEYGIVKAAIFGSVARGESNADSDIDFIVSFGGKYDLLDLVGLKQDIEDIMNKSVDLITYDALKDNNFARSVLQEAKVVYEQN